MSAVTLEGLSARERETGREGDADTSVIILTGPPMLEEV